MGVILFECATGAKPFLADSLFDLLRKHVEAPPPSPRALRADLSPELESVILMALAKVPEQRFSTALAMSMALQHATTGLPAEAWMPITGSGVHRPSSGWQHTPPASWGGGGGTNRSPAPPQHISHQTTVSASSGQVKQQPPAKPPSKKGLWIGLAAIALVGGGITVAVLASGGSSSSEPVAATTPPPAPPPPAAGSGSVAAAAAGSDEADIDDDIMNQLPAEVQQELAALDGVSP